jgi:SH3-like domain-containing protein
MSLGERIREWLDQGVGSGRRRSHVQAQRIGGPVGYEQRPLQRAQWVGLGLAAAAAVALTAGLVFLVLTLTRPGEPRVSPTPSTAGQPAAASPSPPPSLAKVFATSTPTLAPPPTSSPPGERVQVANTDREGANLRRDATASSERIRVIPEGSVLEVVGPDRQSEGRTWRNVRDFDGETGWIPSSFLVAEGTVPPPSASAPGSSATIEPVAGATAAPKPQASRAQISNTQGQGANIRSEPGASGRVLKTLAEGTTVDVLGPSREADGRTWRQVRDSAGVTGWVTGGALVAPGSVPAPPPPGSRPTAAPSAPGPTAAPGPASAPGPTSAPSGPSGAATATPRPAGTAPAIPPPSIFQPQAPSSKPTQPQTTQPQTTQPRPTTVVPTPGPSGRAPTRIPTETPPR